jgi:two-component system, chemotaxis family, protein-glutamate methylesterase/glutaminase
MTALGNIHVLVVDDSALVREVMTAVLGADPRIEVSTAADPLIAMQKMARRRPDVILLDLEMPRMGGIEFLRRIMATDPIPVVICSGGAAHGTSVALRALEQGAVEIITKPKVGVSGFLHESAVLLLDAVWAAAKFRGPKSKGTGAASRSNAPLSSTSLAHQAKEASGKIIALGASTGGTEALRDVLEAMPPTVPGIAIVQHMPAGFTRAFANSLNQNCRIEVREACDGDPIVDGCALIAPGNRHMAVRRTGTQYAVELSDGPLVSRHRPSVDVLFHSVAESAGANAFGVIMTGMGDDGAKGLLEMRRAGAFTTAQDEATSVVFGMPREAIVCGAALRVVPLECIAGAILSWANKLNKIEGANR